MVAPDGSKPGKPQLSNFKEKPGMLQHILQWDQAATLWINGSQSLFLDGFFMAITQTVTWLPLIAVLLYVLIQQRLPSHRAYRTLHRSLHPLGRPDGIRLLQALFQTVPPDTRPADHVPA